MFKKTIGKVKREIKNSIWIACFIFSGVIVHGQNVDCGSLLSREKEIKKFPNKLELLNCLIKNEGDTKLSLKWSSYLRKKNGEAPEKISVSSDFIQNRDLTTVQLTSLFLFNAIIDEQILNKSVIMLCDDNSCTSNINILKFLDNKRNIIDGKKNIYRL